MHYEEDIRCVHKETFSLLSVSCECQHSLTRTPANDVTMYILAHTKVRSAYIYLVTILYYLMLELFATFICVSAAEFSKLQHSIYYKV